VDIQIGYKNHPTTSNVELEKIHTGTTRREHQRCKRQQATSNNGSLFHTLVSILSHPLFNPTHPNSFTTMMKLSTLFATTTYLLSFVTTHVSAEDPYVYGKDPKKDAEYDISMGMAGIQQAAKDPKLLAQLFQDMQVSFFSSCFGGRLDCRCRRVFGG
jgi:hypothetical protein